jgi:peptide deformylase
MATPTNTKKVLPRTHFGNPVLRKRAKNVPRSEIGTPAFNNLIKTMFRTMHHAKGIGLAAPQIDKSMQLAVIELEGEKIIVINPKILAYGKKSDEIWEGCLSLPGVRGVVPRPTSIVVEYTDEYGKRLTFEVEGLLARVFQHEIDHLNGTVYVDRIADIKTLIAEDEYMNRIVKAGK